MGDVSMTVRQAATEFAKLKTAYAAKNYGECDVLLDAIKKHLVFLPTFLNPTAESPTRTQEVALTREVLEHAVLVAAENQDMDAFERHFAMLRTYYNDLDSCPGVERSERRLMILGMNLVRLLVVQHLAEFHSALDHIDVKEHHNMFIKTPIMLERYVMEGSYNRLLTARTQVPCNEFLPLVDMLADTVRQSIARCIPETYLSLSLADAKKMLMLSSDSELKTFAERREWAIDASGARFTFPQADDAASRKELNFKALLTENLQIAAQLQSVV